jgi:large subunit ribosomal protein L35
MPKQRSHSGTKKRFRVTRTGKILHGRQNKNHLLEKKTSAHKRRISGTAALTGGDAKSVRRLLGS